MDLTDIAVSDLTLAFTEVIRLGFYFLFHFFVNEGPLLRFTSKTFYL